MQTKHAQPALIIKNQYNITWNAIKGHNLTKKTTKQFNSPSKPLCKPNNNKLTIELTESTHIETSMN